MFQHLKLICLLGMIFLFGSSLSAIEPAQKKRILVGSPIRQKPAILNEFLESLNRQNQNTYTLDYYFIDDNVIDESKQLIKNFGKGKNCTIDEIKLETGDESYVCDENNHKWKDKLIWKVASFKDLMIEKGIKDNYDYLFLIDSDLVLHPNTIEQLILADKDIISNIFWTSWQPGTIAMPQVWISDQYTQFKKGDQEVISNEEALKRTLAFYEELKTPGVYEVGGLGACTLISQNALKKGISFRKLSNLSFWGEDRHFCIRAVALGIPLFVDTHYPAYHIYRESAMDGVEQFKADCLKSVLEKKKESPFL